MSHLGKGTKNNKETEKSEENVGSRTNWKVEGRWKSAKAPLEEIVRKDKDDEGERDYDSGWTLMDASEVDYWSQIHSDSKKAVKAAQLIGKSDSNERWID